MLLSITFRTIRHTSRRIVFYAVRRDDFLVGQAVSPVIAPAVAGILAARLLSGAANLGCSRLSAGSSGRAFVQLFRGHYASLVRPKRSAKLQAKHVSQRLDRALPSS